MKVKFILPALIEAKSQGWRPIKYSLFPPLALATLAAFLDTGDEAEIVDEHVEKLELDDTPDLVAIQVYVTNAFRAYKIADHYRSRGVYVILGGLHVTSMPDEAALHADSIFLGPAEHAFPAFLRDFREKKPGKRYRSSIRSLHDLPPPRRDLIKRQLYLVPNTILVSRGCPHHCHFCYKDSFFQGGKSFYTQKADDALAEIERLPGKHLYFLDDHLLGDPVFAEMIFSGMRGMNCVFQGAATVDSILRGNTIEKAAKAGLKSIFIGFESLSAGNLEMSNKRQNIGKDYRNVIQRLDDLGIMINGSFVFGLDHDDRDVFKRTVDWAVNSGITTATFHIATPYPGTMLYKRMEREGRIITRNWDLYDTRHVVFKPARLSPGELKKGYDTAYKEFYQWSAIFKASTRHTVLKQKIKHLVYSAGWKKFEPLWNTLIHLKRLKHMRPLLERLLGRSPGKKISLPGKEKNPSLDTGYGMHLPGAAKRS